jgi:hypothetical protein
MDKEVKMKSTISYSRTVGSNEGMPDYSNKTMAAEIEVPEGVDLEVMFKSLQQTVDKALLPYPF